MQNAALAVRIRELEGAVALARLLAADSARGHCPAHPVDHDQRRPLAGGRIGLDGGRVARVGRAAAEQRVLKAEQVGVLVARQLVAHDGKRSVQRYTAICCH